MAASIATILGVLGALMTFVISKLLHMGRLIDRITAETQPNGGKSMRDAIDRLSEKVDRIDRELHRLAGAFDQHTKENYP
jgi:hypothetical protein